MITDERIEQIIKEIYIEEIERMEIRVDIEELIEKAYEEAEKRKKIPITG
ncbi:MAG: hypothetical protein Q4C14_02420 [Bacillota bacterium]|nr:hypothetical protein [Bacillota bacterium]